MTQTTLPLATAWRRTGLQWLLLAGLLLLAQWGAASSMAQLWWRSETFAHALLVPPITLWLVWRRRDELLRLAPAPWWPGALALLPAVLVAQIGSLAEVNALQHFGLVFSLQALSVALVGPAAARVLAFPLAFLLFAPPFGEFLTPLMMLHTADFVVATVRFSGVPVYREGLDFIIPSGNWSVVEACSGIRYLMASFMVGTLFAYLNFPRWRGRLGFMGVALLVPVIANWLRAYFIVMLGHWSDNRIATGVDHLVYGWVFFGIVMALMFWIGGRWADASAPAPAAAPQPLVAVGRISWPLAALLAAVLLLPAAGAWQLRSRAERTPALPADPFAALPLPAGWQRLSAGDGPWTPVFSQPDHHWRASWRDTEGRVVHLDVGYWRRQRDGSRAVSSTNRLVPGATKIWSAQGGSLVDGAQQSRWALRQGAGEGYIARRLYWVGGVLTASEAEAKWLLLRQLLAGRGDAAANIVWATPERGGGEARLQTFWDALRPPLNERLNELGRAAQGQNPPP